ncbi:MAG: class I SAM-dependent methyltransferase [Propionibacteriales bacterium]|nr:class I SAM-dependent methyltransferase [Propionibacteriales bacterium]
MFSSTDPRPSSQLNVLRASGTQSPIFQHPLAYLVGLEGVALLKAFAGEFDREFTEARLAEVRLLLDAGVSVGNGVEVPPLATTAGYDGWAAHYDSPDNGIFLIEERYILPIFDSLPVGSVIDAGCGTGRHSAYLASRGHDVLGFDSSPGMLAIARDKVPTARFALADLCALPVADDSADVLVCALALAHVENLSPVFAEAVRVLRPGGRFIISDTRGHFIGSPLYPLVEWDVNGDYGYMAGWRHSTIEYLRAALTTGFKVHDVHEPTRPTPTVDLTEPPPSTVPVEHPELPPNIWGLHAWAPEATNAAKRDDPVLIVWDFELEKSWASLSAAS